MNCPKCGFQNPPDAKYCQKCANVFVSSDQSNSSNEPKIQVMPQGHLPVQEQKKEERSSLMPENYASQRNEISVGENAPLKKLNQLFKDSISLTWQKKWRFVYLNLIPKILSLLIAIIPLIGVFILYALFSFVFAKIFELSSTATSIINIALGALAVAVFIFTLIAYGLSWSVGSYIYYIQTQEQSKKVILKQTFKKVWGLFWVSMLKSLITLVGLILFIIPGIVWGVKYGFAPLAYLIEGHKGRQSLKRSAQLTKGYKWPILKRSILFSYFQILIQIIFTIIFVLINLFGGLGAFFTILSFILYFILVLINIFISLLLEPFGYVYDFDIYKNLAENKEVNVNNREIYSFWHKLWAIVLILIFPLIALGIGLGSNALNTISGSNFTNNLNRFLPEEYKIQESETESNVSATNPFEELSAQNRDSYRISKIKQIQTALTIYFMDFNQYPMSQEKINLSNEKYSCFNFETGFVSADECGSESDNFNLTNTFNSEFNSPEFDYYYQSMGVISYRIDFKLEVGNDELSAGEHFATPAGIDKEDIVLDLSLIDSDNDGLLDDEENNIWFTDPLNPDTDGDGYLDGDEVDNGYDPLVAGSARLEYR